MSAMQSCRSLLCATWLHGDVFSALDTGPGLRMLSDGGFMPGAPLMRVAQCSQPDSPKRSLSLWVPIATKVR